MTVESPSMTATLAGFSTRHFGLSPNCFEMSMGAEVVGVDLREIIVRRRAHFGLDVHRADLRRRCRRAGETFEGLRHRRRSPGLVAGASSTGNPSTFFTDTNSPLASNVKT